MLDYEDMPNSPYTIDIPSTKLFIRGEDIDYSSDRCYLSIFGQEQGKQDAWYIGNIILSEFYLVFDMTYYDNRMTDYLQVGMAPTNPNGLKFEQ